VNDEEVIGVGCQSGNQPFCSKDAASRRLLSCVASALDASLPAFAGPLDTLLMAVNHHARSVCSLKFIRLHLLL
jgi:hypothetical protein